MRYWWVNHKQTLRHEIAGSFLWSPMYKADGRHNHFYDNMREAAPGDAVISFANAQICFIGVVSDFAIPTPKPPVFGNTGENWDKNSGWLLPVSWKKLSVPVRPKQVIEHLRKILPLKYSPISLKTGNGNQGAYLAEVGVAVFEFLVVGIHPLSLAAPSAFKVLDEIDENIKKTIFADGSLDSTTKDRLVAARIGQGVFKDRIYEFEKSCRLTNVSTPNLLIASHIKPWRLCTTAFERLDGANGLLLTPHVDFLFDRGYISFDDNGAVLVSDRVNLNDFKLLGLDLARGSPCFDFHPRQLKYIKFHRDSIFMN
ncbi:HNH endonuclease [Pseudomonas tremae]|uniref:HNH endonuclease n=1 Tax=Pseudomonas syringae group TaxID=136849 RepID=UPI0001AF3C25|nr:MULTISPECIES: HNH endonuclease [Pseudomonas syringae group]KPZ21024.1 Uncharacterized protein ALO38_01290 [Pseudomonas coronafaciens pv. zizaniae]MCQ3015450.1 HNH endonuclease [Pseudomonas tremae]QGL56041.1 HNH endonuclease [Pseudomonas coronafaciens pv. oryzae str. 1_6]RMM35084.1 hypothetical protein ALQ80_03620 [Pseudomonas coronafaciens pv. oryzae]